MIRNDFVPVLGIKYTDLEAATLVCRALNHTGRQKMIKLMHQEQKIAVANIYIGLLLEETSTSQHLAILRRADLVKTERAGKAIYYSVNYRRFMQVHNSSKELCSSCDF